MKEFLLMGGILFLLWQFGFWVLFGRLGMVRWLSLLPGYNLYRFCQRVYGNGIYGLFFLLPLGNLFFWTYSLYCISKGFRKSNRYLMGLVFLFPLFVFLLSARKPFQRPIIKAKSLILCIVIFGLIGCVGSTYAISKGYVPWVTAAYSDHITHPQVTLSETDISTHPDFSMKTLKKEVTMPILKGSDVTKDGATFTESGLTVSINLQKQTKDSLSNRMETLLETQKEELLAAGFGNPVIGAAYGDMTQKSEVMCQINYETAAGEKQYRMLRLTKQDSFEVLLIVDYNSAATTEATMPLLAEICTVYGMTFQGDMIIRDVTKPITP